MSKNFILVKDDIFLEEECKQMIDHFGKKCIKGEKPYLGYDFYDIETFQYINKIRPVIEEYKNKFKGIQLTASKWKLDYFRFKHFKPGKNFDLWHSEHTMSHCTRVLNVQMYLSDHNCGTQFLDYETIKSVIGRVAIFPCYFTHTHKGQVCPENKDRYLITAYVNFYDKGPLE